MFQKIIKYLSVAQWITLLMIIIFADTIGISYQPYFPQPTKIGIYQILGIIFALIGTIISLWVAFGDQIKKRRSRNKNPHLE